MATFEKNVENYFNLHESVEAFYSLVQHQDLDVDELCIVCKEYLKANYTETGIKELFNIE